jgi:hypothetical protein
MSDDRLTQLTADFTRTSERHTEVIRQKIQPPTQQPGPPAASPEPASPERSAENA